MTSLQYAHWLMDSNWTPSVSGRYQNVPKPQLVYQSSEERRRISTGDEDTLIIRDGGPISKEPQGLRWDSERKLSRVTLDLRTSGSAGSVNGRQRMFGVRDSSGVSEDYGGLTGEVERIIDEVRRGDKEYDLIKLSEINNLSGQTGTGMWRATAEVELDDRLRLINPPPSTA